MPRFISNVLIVLAMAVIITGVITLTTDSVPYRGTTAERIESTAQVESADRTVAEDDAADAEVVETTSETTGDTAAETATETTDETADAGDETVNTPSYLDPEPAASADGARVLGAVQVQESDDTADDAAGEELANTGPIEVPIWISVAMAIFATGMVVRRAGADAEAGTLTVLP